MLNRALCDEVMQAYTTEGYAAAGRLAVNLIRNLRTDPAELIRVRHWVDLEREYLLSFPLAEIANAIALCGWTLSNAIQDFSPAAAAEVARLEALPELPIPDGRQWFARYAVRQPAAVS